MRQENGPHCVQRKAPFCGNLEDGTPPCVTSLVSFWRPLHGQRRRRRRSERYTAAAAKVQILQCKLTGRAYTAGTPEVFVDGNKITAKLTDFFVGSAFRADNCQLMLALGPSRPNYKLVIKSLALDGYIFSSGDVAF